MDATNPTKATCQFSQCEKWMQKYIGLDDPLNPMVPQDWRQGLQLPDLPSGADETKECDDLLVLQDLRKQAGKTLEADIRDQAPSPYAAVAAVWGAIGINPMAPPNKALIELQLAVIDCMRAPIFLLKIAVDRARPGCCCKSLLSKAKLEPMFELPDNEHPGHPSYPSGHAALAYAMALVLKELAPLKWQSLKAAAVQVGKNRESAGVHFASDSDAGRALAEHIVLLLLRPTNVGFAALMKKAAAAVTWP